ERLANYVRPDEMHQAFNFHFLVTPWSAGELRTAIARSLAATEFVGAPTTWVQSNHDVVRHASRLGLAETGKGPNGIFATDAQPDADVGLARARAVTVLMLALPGAAYLYQGEELGLPEHTALPDAVREDPAFARTKGKEAGRDGCRVPIPWESGAPAFGFSPNGKSWLPQPAVYGELAPDRQRGFEGSKLEMYRAALRLRRELGLGRAALAEVPRTDPDVLHLVSTTPRGRRVHVLTVTGGPGVDLPGGWRVLL